ncbi:MAG: acyltransferase [Cytophagales bacterium]|nr:acyltransferase [Cytophagales bacterium]
MEKRHFHSLNAFRFLFFLLVFLVHTPYPDDHWLGFIMDKGGVAFFFVLSGFLITYFLLFEKKAKGIINLKKFHKKRILRIYPLFYLMIAFAYTTPYILELLNLPHNDQGYSPNLLTSVFFLENYAMIYTGSFPDGAPLRVMWSLCVNEHFYIIWGLLLSFLSIKKVPYLLAFSIIGAFGCRLLYSSFEIPTLDLFTHIDYFAFGAIPAYWLIEKPKIFTFLNPIPAFIKYLFLVLVIITPKLFFGIFSESIFACLFSLLLVLTLSSENSLKINDKWWFSKLGKYTYGMYLYHTICILLVIQLVKKLGLDIHWGLSLLISLSLTVIVSILSYYIFEAPILKLKKRIT